MDISRTIGSLLKRFRYGSRIDPQRDWFALLTILAIAFAALVVWNVWAFDTVAQGGTIGASATSTPPVFSPSALDAIQAIFTDRAAEEQKYQTGTYRFADPSQ